MSFAWTDARLAFLKEQWAAGLSATQIADAFTVGPGEERPSRSAVCGKLYRIGEGRFGKAVNGARLERRTHSYKRAAIKAKKKADKAAKREQAKARQKAILEGKPVQPRDLVEVSLHRNGEPRSLDLTLLQLRDATEEREGTCKWAYGDGDPRDFRFCGEPTTPGKVYCDYHCQRAYSPHAPRKGTVYYVHQRHRARNAA